MNDFIKRTLSGILFVVLIIGSILIHPYVFALVFATISAWSVYEFHSITNNQENVEVVPATGMIGAFLLFTLSFFDASTQYLFPIYSLYGLYIVVILVIELFKKKKNPIHNWAYFVLGQVIIAFPFALLNFIYNFGASNKLYVIAMFSIIWLNDTGAYLAGVSFGKHKMFKRVSPKKSWEGFIGGTLAAILAAYVLSLFIIEISLINWIIISLIIVCFGTFGDLMESLLKRTLEVKDSGNIMPGHGGFLDRFDSMLLAAPAYFVFLSFLFK